MANFEDPYNLLRYVRKTFIEHDETGLCGEFIGDKLPEKVLLPTMLHSYEKEEEQSSSSEDYSDWDFEKMDLKVIKSCGGMPEGCEGTEGDEGKSREDVAVAPLVCETDREIMFERKEINKNRKVGRSLLSCQLEQRSLSAGNPFVEYAKYEGTYQFRADTRTFRIFLTMLRTSERDYPLRVCIISSAKVSDLIGLTCFKYTTENPNGTVCLKEDVNEYGLYIADDRGEVDWEFPSLDPNVRIEKFYLQYLALVELSEINIPRPTPNEKTFTSPKVDETEDESREKVTLETAEQLMEDLRIMASLVRETFRVNMVYKKRKKLKVGLAISLDKVEIEVDPDSECSGKVVPKALEISRKFDAREIMACEILKKKSHNRTIFRIINYVADASGVGGYRNNDFESDAVTAEKIIDKLNTVLEVRSSALRKHYLENTPKEKKGSGLRQIFSLWPR